MTIAVFDLDDTLIDRAAAWRSWCDQFLARHGVRDRGATWLTSVDDSGRADRSEVLTAIRDRYGLGFCVDEELDRYRSEFPRLQRCRFGTFEALEQLRSAGWSVAIVTNGPHTQAAKIDAASLQDRVDAVVISGVEGCRKPSPRIYEIAAQRCGVTIDAVEWVVGDDPDTDMVGARNVNAHSVWIRNGRGWPRSDFRPTAEADSIAEAVRHILGRTV